LDWFCSAASADPPQASRNRPRWTGRNKRCRNR